MSLLSELQRIMDMQDPIKEAEKKLVKTWMFVNGILCQIQSFDVLNDTVIFRVQGTDSDKLANVESLEVFLPQSGIYTCTYKKKTIPVLITKEQKKQWLKSFSLTYYNIRCLDPNIIVESPYFLVDGLDATSYKEIFVNNNREILYYNKPIGYIKNNSTIVCTNILYKQELLDWNKSCQ